MCLGVPGQIVSIVDPVLNIAKVEVSGVKRNINIGLLQPAEAQVGNWVLIHVGFALSQIDEKEARETLALLTAMGDQFEQEMDAMAESARLKSFEI